MHLKTHQMVQGLRLFQVANNFFREMADSCIATNFEKRKSTKGDSARSEGFHFLKDEYLHVSI